MKKTLFTLMLLCGFYSTAQHSTYYIGHSGFGWDLIVGEMVNDLATDAGHTTYDYGFQFIGGTCIANQWFNHDNPQGGTDSHVELATGNYDVLVLAEQIPIQEVIYGSQWCNSNVITSVEAVDSFHTVATNANPNTRIYLMEFHNEADSTSPTGMADWMQLNADMRPLWEQVADSSTLINPGGPQVCIVPVAAAFQALADSIINGSVPGYTSPWEIFDPNDPSNVKIHPTEETYYLVACVHYAVIFGESPAGLTNETFAAAGWPFDPPTPAQAAIFQDIAWEVVSNDPYACLPTTNSITENQTGEMNFYPNPSLGAFKIVSSIEGATQVQIFNMMGQQVLTETVNQNSITEIVLEPGSYIALYQNTNGELKQEKLIVQ